MTKKLTISLITLLIALGQVGIVLPRPAGAQPQPKIRYTLVPSKVQPQPNEQITVTVYTSPLGSNPLRMAFLYLQYDPAQVQISNITHSTTPPFNNWTITSKNDTAQNRIEVIGVYLGTTASDYLTTTTPFMTFNLAWTGTQNTSVRVLANLTASSAMEITGTHIPAEPTSLDFVMPGTGGTGTAPITATQECDSCGKCVGNPRIPPEYNQCMACHAQKGKQWTPIGCVDASTGGFVQNVLQVVFGIAGGVSFLALLYGGVTLLGSKGNSEQIQQGRRILIGALSGLILVLFSVFIIEFLGFTIFGLPGIGR